MLKGQAKCSVYPRVVAVNRPHIPWQRLKREKVISPGCIVYLSPAPGFPPLFFALKNAIPPFFLKAQHIRQASPSRAHLRTMLSFIASASLSLNVGSPALTVARAPAASMVTAMETKFVYGAVVPLGTTQYEPKLEGVMGKVVPTGMGSKSPKFLEETFCYGAASRWEGVYGAGTPPSMGENRRSWQAYHAAY